MKYGLIVYKNSFNLGDDIQSYANECFLPHTDYIIEREKMDTFYTESGEKVAVIMGGWYLYNHLNWPPSPFIIPLPISMHFDTYYSEFAGEKINRNFVFEDYGGEWLINNGPIGCRDMDTLNLLNDFGISGYFSGCNTLTLKPFEEVEKNNKICLIDVSKQINEYLRNKTNKEILSLTHSINMAPLEWNERRRIVEERLKLYQGASLVVTTRLHAALPCLALGTPVLLIKEDWSLNRIGTWLDYLNYTTEDDLLSGTYEFDFDNPKSNLTKYKEIANYLRTKCEEFISKYETSQNTESLDVKMFLDGKRRVERLQKLMELRIDKYERKLKEK